MGFSGALLGARELPGEARSRPPVMLIHGDADDVVPVQALFMAVEGLQAAEIPVQWIVRPGLPHSIDPDGIDAGGRFLASTLWAAGASGPLTSATLASSGRLQPLDDPLPLGRLALPLARTAATTSGEAVSGRPASNGGAGAYSRFSWMASACGRPTSSAAKVSAMSMPAVTPPPLMNLPSVTTRARSGTAPSRARKSWLAQCVVARLPSSSPAAASTRAPVQTEVTKRAPALCRRRKSSTSASSISALTPTPPGTQSTSSCGQSASCVSGTSTSPVAEMIGSQILPDQPHLGPGDRGEDLVGPGQIELLHLGEHQQADISVAIERLLRA